uniref:ATP synthase complex subunit 8 n=2 Tax=Eleutheronema TaxID=210138 RepID=A0A1Y0EXQ2_9TELE|nr:ATP synthase subunit 8 [Eleutheronema tetradactylum]QVT11302.1 ATP synthase F0 subunit 8 [Eleutheronema rhadinum]ARU09774.1 ATP synthase subunit 8 [Eleutheronema tetradactylum]ARU09776.1 ATP synthase subunit 8 [Eleutheronema tetradactylum]ARU09778.1 ATP synthase subunit 8 [Eleutheronema tetradactylum]
MPQLNPAPWLYILVTSWIILLIVVLPKILDFIIPNELTLQSANKVKQDSWLWPWF